MATTYHPLKRLFSFQIWERYKPVADSMGPWQTGQWWNPFKSLYLVEIHMMLHTFYIKSSHLKLQYVYLSGLQQILWTCSICRTWVSVQRTVAKWFDLSLAPRKTSKFHASLMGKAGPNICLEIWGRQRLLLTADCKKKKIQTEKKDLVDKSTVIARCSLKGWMLTRYKPRAQRPGKFH